LGVLNRAFDRPFAIRILDATRIRDDAVMREQGGVHRIQGGFVQVRPNDARFQIVEDDVLRTAAERAKGFLVELRPHLLRRLPHHFPKTLPRILERPHKQPRAFVFAIRLTRRGALSEIDLRFLPRRKLQHIEALRHAPLEPRDEPFDRVVVVQKSVGLDQVLIHTHGVPATHDLGFNPRAMRFAR